ncbi:MAG: hypothetical protein H7Y04_09060 [Verrucomicrobia bacterium]|nr:hypothetical protein [Cytophagales bacterium]
MGEDATQHQREQTRNLCIEDSCTDKLGLSLVLLSFSFVTLLSCLLQAGGQAKEK